jgi:mercuric ion binding protein
MMRTMRTMRTMRKLVAALLIGLPVAAFAASPQTAVLDLQNMTCSMCSITIRKALERVPGVIDARVDYDHKTAIVKYNPEQANPSALVKATTNAGFPSKLHNGTQQ